MRPCLVGIGGAGGNLVKQFLQSRDVSFKFVSFGDYPAYGGVMGVWLDSDQDEVTKQSFFGRMMDGKYPGYIISHDVIEPNSNTRNYIKNTYGHDLKVQGYDRRAEYLKAVFEIFEKDPEVRDIAKKEFGGETNPIPLYIWENGLRNFTSIGTGANNNGTQNQQSQPSGLRMGRLSRILGVSGSPIEGGNEGCGLFVSKPCNSILFMASLGGGTGTGFINPLSSYVREEEKAFPIFALGMLTERGEDIRHADEGKRNLASVIAVHDLLTKESGNGIDALILVDNQILFEKFGNNYDSIDQKVFDALKPLLDPRNYPDAMKQDDAPAFRGHVSLQLPPILIPCHHIRNWEEKGEAKLVAGALEAGKLFPCDTRSADDMAFVFTRGLVSETAIIKAVNACTRIPENKVMVYRKIGDPRYQEILILLRNPYGGQGPNSLDARLKEIISSAIGFLDANEKIRPGEISLVNQVDYTQKTRDLLQAYFYGPGKLRDLLKGSLKRLEQGEYPVFTEKLDIIDDDHTTQKRSVKSGEPTDDGTFTTAQREEIESIVNGIFQKHSLAKLQESL